MLLSHLINIKSLIISGDLKQLVRETKRIADNDNAVLRIGYYKGYHGNELSEAIALFSEKYPTVDVKIMVGSHEELYYALENGSVDLAINDQRRAFSDAYNNEVLAESRIYIELSVKKIYCAFWEKDNSGYYIEEFAQTLKSCFSYEL